MKTETHVQKGALSGRVLLCPSLTTIKTLTYKLNLYCHESEKLVGVR